MLSFVAENKSPSNNLTSFIIRYYFSFKEKEFSYKEREIKLLSDLKIAEIKANLLHFIYSFFKIMFAAEESPRKKSMTVSSNIAIATSPVLTEEDIDTQNNIFTFGKASVKKLTNRDIFLMKEAFLAQERRGLLNVKVALLTPEAAPATREDIQWLYEKRAEALRGVQLYIDDHFQIFIFKCPDRAHGGGTIAIASDVGIWTRIPVVDQYLGAAANGGNPHDFGEMQPDVFI